MVLDGRRVPMQSSNGREEARRGPYGQPCFGGAHPAAESQRRFRLRPIRWSVQCTNYRNPFPYLFLDYAESRI